MTKTPIEALVDARTPGTVHFEITVNWPDQEPATYAGIDLPLARAADKLEVIVDELRAAVQA